MEKDANASAEGELLDLVDEFSDGRIQFAFVKVKDPNTSLPKNVLIAWVSSPPKKPRETLLTDAV